jgi:hypothetical protein
MPQPAFSDNHPAFPDKHAGYRHGYNSLAGRRARYANPSYDKRRP